MNSRNEAWIDDLFRLVFGSFFSFNQPNSLTENSVTKLFFEKLYRENFLDGPVEVLVMPAFILPNKADFPFRKLHFILLPILL